MEFEGIVYKVLPPVSGTSARGEWKKQEVVFELPNEFSRKICVTFFGDKTADAASLKEGDPVSVSVNVESREYNGRWYTDVRAWRIVKKSAPAPEPDNMAPFDPAPFPASETPIASEEGDDLPF